MQSLEELVYKDLIKEAGVDFESRPILVFYACYLPDPHTSSYEQLTALLMSRLDNFVECDYVMVLFSAAASHTPSWGWLIKAYRSLGRKYRKNLKALYICHPQKWTKILMKTMTAAVSPKFARKLVWIPTLSNLSLHVPIKQIFIPHVITQIDELAEQASNTSHSSISSSVIGMFGRKNSTETKHRNSNALSTLVNKYAAKSNVFGVSPEKIMGVNGERGLPRVISESIHYILTNGIDVEGIFRRSPASNTLAQVKAMYEKNQHNINLDAYEDVHIACVLLKMYFRELPVPVFQKEMYGVIRDMDKFSKTDTERIQFIKSCLIPLMSIPVYMLCKAVFGLLHQVHLHSSINKMTSVNICIVWTPNLVKSEDAVADFSMCSLAGGSAGAIVRLFVEQYPLVFTQ